MTDKEQIDGFWEYLGYAWEIEPREWFEATHGCTSGPLFMAAHYMSKRDTKKVVRLREALESLRNEENEAFVNQVLAETEWPWSLT
jgi:hypothetical protein